jgi:hypothetical protein
MAMGRLGYPIMSDDLVPIFDQEGETRAQPGYPRMRLRESSLFMLSKLNPRLPPLPKVAGKERLHFELTSGGYRFQRDPLPIGAVYLLGNRIKDPRAPYVESVSPLDGLMGIVANTYVTRFLDISMRAIELHELTQLVSRVPVRKVHPHREPSRLEALCHTILDDVGYSPSTASAV